MSQENTADIITEQPTKENPPKYTGASLTKPKRDRIINRVANGQGWNSAARDEHVAPQTVRAYRERHPDWERAMADKLAMAAELASDKYLEALAVPVGLPGSVNVNYLPVHTLKALEARAMLTSSAQPDPGRADQASIGSALAALAQLCQAKADPERTVTVTVKSEPALPVIDCQAEQTGGGDVGLPGQG